jgi:hypothetical protein
MHARSWINALGVAGAFACSLAVPAEAQQRRDVSVELVTGHAGYIDEVWDNRIVAGGLLRVALTPRLALGPEVVYLHGPSDEHELLVTATATYDLISHSPTRRLVPFVVMGAGLSRRSSLVGRGPDTPGLRPYSTIEPTASGGVGVRIAVARSLFVSGDARLGLEPERRLTVTFGWKR